MNIPLFKIAICTVKFCARPVNTVLVNRFKAQSTGKPKRFFVWFGTHCYTFENKLNKYLIES